MRFIPIIAILTSGASFLPLSAQADSADFPCLNPPSMNSTVPSDTPIADQNSLNCFAWQEFIALNWTASDIDTPAPDDPMAYFGRPGDLTPTVWETYSDIHHVFLKDGAHPPPFGHFGPQSEACAAHLESGKRVLTRDSKFNVNFEFPEDVAEAFPFNGAPAWLADRDGNQVFYEILMNRDEYDYIVENELYNAMTAYLKTAGGQHVDLPRGKAGGAVGSIELKAAWIEVPDPENTPKWGTYKLSEAVIHDQAEGTCDTAIVALAGLHIIHKTTSQPQWIWATFEHKNNAPDQRDVDSGNFDDIYRFFNPACAPIAIPKQCVGNVLGGCDSNKIPGGAPDMTSCVPNTPPGYCVSSECAPSPVQVTRQFPIPNGQDNLVQDANKAAQALIREAAGEDSVFANYMLIDVLWSDSPVDENITNRPPPTTPLSISGMRPSPTEHPISNTTMETYIQGTTCIMCHQGAGLNQPTGFGDTESFASDYSFSFSNAQFPPNAE